MENLNQPVIKKDYKTFKEALNALPQRTREHSIRVADYTKELFQEAMAIEFRVGNEDVAAQLDFDNVRGAYLAGLYHDIGKVLLPIEYQDLSPDFSAEEIALYRKHTADGRAMSEQMAFAEDLNDISKKMIRDAIELHHQKPDGGGFPEVAREKDVDLMPLLVGFADTFDHLVTERRSEDPFDDVMAELLERFPEDSETEFHLLLTESYQKLRRVFLKYEDQSQKFPTVLPFVKRKQNRPFELRYRPIVDRRHKSTVAFQAEMSFKDAKDQYADYEEVKPILNANKLIPDLGRYFIYEAGDTYKRIEACELPIQYIALELMPKFFSQPKIVQTILAQLEDARMEKGKVVFVLDESAFENPPKALMANLERLTAAEIPLMLYNYSGAYLKADEVTEYSFTKIALSPSLYPELESDETVAMIGKFKEKGIELIAGELDKTKYNGALNRLEISLMTGMLAGDYITEDEAIGSELGLMAGK